MKKFISLKETCLQIDLTEKNVIYLYNQNKIKGKFINDELFLCQKSLDKFIKKLNEAREAKINMYIDKISDFEL